MQCTLAQPLANLYIQIYIHTHQNTCIYTCKYTYTYMLFICSGSKQTMSITEDDLEPVEKHSKSQAKVPDSDGSYSSELHKLFVCDLQPKCCL